jgi:plasmid stabilization system protein ParE
MISNQGFKLHPEAARDITDIWEYIAEENLRAASCARGHPGYHTQARTLPTSRPQTTGSYFTSLRFQTVGNYLIAYAPDEKPLLIIAVLHGKRNPHIIAAILSSRK